MALVLITIAGAATGTVSLSRLRQGVLALAPSGARYRRYERWTYLLALTPLLGFVGVQLILPTIAATILAWLGAQAALVWWPSGELRFENPAWLPGIFFLSGFAALIYQVTWQRALFASLGVDIQSVTLIVSTFMFGLGLGALAGGWLSERYPSRLITIFLASEIGIALFGIVSLPLIWHVTELAQAAGRVAIAAVVFALLFVPTLLMGITLPVLVTQVNRRVHDVGQTVGLLYFVNTLGSAFASAMTVDVVFAITGLRQATWLAAAFNAGAAVLVFLHARATSREAR